MPFDDVFAFPTSRPSGVAAAVAAAADVARATEEQHDEPTCCGERQVTDVGEGWQMLRSGKDGAILRDGDEWCYGDKGWTPVPTHWVGERAINNTNRYRRRVTPEEQPLGASLDEENNELRQQVATLTAEVERLRLTPSEREAIAFFNNAWALEMWKPHGETLRKLLNRLGGGK